MAWPLGHKILQSWYLESALVMVIPAIRSTVHFLITILPAIPDINIANSPITQQTGLSIFAPYDDNGLNLQTVSVTTELYRSRLFSQCILFDICRVCHEHNSGYHRKFGNRRAWNSSVSARPLFITYLIQYPAWKGLILKDSSVHNLVHIQHGKDSLERKMK